MTKLERLLAGLVIALVCWAWVQADRIVQLEGEIACECVCDCGCEWNVTAQSVGITNVVPSGELEELEKQKRKERRK